MHVYLSWEVRVTEVRAISIDLAHPDLPDAVLGAILSGDKTADVLVDYLTSLEESMPGDPRLGYTVEDRYLTVPIEDVQEEETDDPDSG